MYKEIKELFKHFSIYGMGNILRRVVGFLMIPIYTRYLSPQDYGIVNLINIVFTLLGSVIGLHIVDAMMRFYYEYEGEERKKIVSTTLISSCLSSFVLILLFLVFSEQISLIVFGSEKFSIFFIIASISTSLLVVTTNSFCYLRARLLSLRYMILSLVQFVVSFLFVVLFIVVLKKGVVGFFLSQAFSYFLILIIFIPMIVNRLKAGFSFIHWKKMFNYAYPLIFSGLLYVLSIHSDKYLIQKYLNLESLGIYSLAFSFGIVIHEIIGIPLEISLGPYIYSRARHVNIKEIISYLTFLSFLILFSCFFIGTIFIKYIVIFIADQKFWQAYCLVPYILFSFCIQVSLIVPAICFAIVKRTNYSLLTSIIRFIFSVLSNVILLPIFGLIGACFSMVITYSAIFLFVMYSSNRLYPVNYKWGRMIGVFAISIGFSFIGFNINFKNPFIEILGKFLLVFLYFVSLFLFRIITAKGIR